MYSKLKTQAVLIVYDFCKAEQVMREKAGSLLPLSFARNASS